MNKKLERKLVLNREDAADAGGEQLEKVIGGALPDTNFQSCGRTCTCECNPK